MAGSTPVYDERPPRLVPDALPSNLGRTEADTEGCADSMNRFSQQHPILFGIILFFAALAACIPFSILGRSLGSAEAGGAVGRIVAGCLLFLLFRPCFLGGKPFSGLPFLVPALLFPLWNIFYHITAGMGTMVSVDMLPTALLLGFAPALFEEVIFRGILMGKLRENGRSPLACLVISSLLFGAIHLTNAVGMPLRDVLLQTGYAVVIALVFGAIYLKSGDLFTVILAHALIDVSSRLFLASPQKSSLLVAALFLLLLAVETGYAFWLVRSGVHWEDPEPL